ncbi:MAG: serine hydrolase domain-containing protein, partial [Candidatus Hodarchaeales archaeon]
MKSKTEKLFTSIILLALISSFSLASLSMWSITGNVDDSSFSFSNLSTQDTLWPGNASEWTVVAPETQGLDSDKIAALFELIEANSYDIHSVIIVRNGSLLTYEYLHNSQLLENKTYFGGEKIHIQQSTTKSVMSILIGIALQEGFLDNLSQTLYEFFADIWEPSFVDSELKKNITIEQLLVHNAGFVGDGDPSYPPGAKILGAIDIINWALDLVPLGFTPGEMGEYQYSNDGPNLLSGIIANVTDNSTLEFAKNYLFSPLGISEDEYDWWHDEQNMYSGGFGFSCSPKVQAKLGMLCLNNGTWNGTQIIDSKYIKAATTNQILGLESYGYLFYPDAPFGGFSAYGAGGQVIYVIPEYDIVIGFAGEDDFVPYDLLVTNYIVQFAADNAPEWDQIPEDQLIQEGDSFFYDVNASDTSGVAYSIDDTVNFNITSEGIITNSLNLSTGVYPLEIRAYNSFNNSLTATINIRVKSLSNNGIPGFN